MKPIIGIVPSINEEEGLYYLHEDNITAIREAGGIPIIIPYGNEGQQVIDIIDGLYLTGGFDIDPTFFEEEPHPNLGKINRLRDEFEIDIIKNIRKVKKPILAVCRGCQILNIAIGGDMYQDINEQIKTPLLQHQQNAIKSHASHFVHVVEGSLLHNLVGTNKIKVNSRHHQANRTLGKHLITSGTSSDGIIEAIESGNDPFVLGLQWHPENLAVKGDETSLHIYHGFIQACKERRNERANN